MILDRVHEFIAQSIAQPGGSAEPSDDATFARLAREVFAHQYENVPLYRRLCELRGAGPRDVTHWWEIPAAPADLFKEESLSCGTDSPARTFLSSGTTQGPDRPSRHVLDASDLDLYRRCSLAHFAAMTMPDSPGPMEIILLGPGAVSHPASSLGQMYQFVIDAFASSEADAPRASLFDAAGKLDVDGAVASLEHAAAGTTPVLVLALRSTITAVLDALRDRRLALRLPADSRLVHTGGTKGGRTMSRAGILKAVWRFLHIPSYLCVEEYGMTELLSQFYDDAFRSRWSGRNEPRAMVGPGWTRTIVVDPATLAPAGRGERGILRHFDLANCGSISCVQTLDLGVAAGRGFEVLGRASGADARGCSQLMSGLSGSIPGSDPAADG
ncbi:MAG TPA: hypothetical protein VN634_21520 [Candidatus Limnocylindrales bacterium]|nr:hypothetical protein [Candidatus Limnocylindrales bacterium]